MITIRTMTMAKVMILKTVKIMMVVMMNGGDAGGVMVVGGGGGGSAMGHGLHNVGECRGGP